MLNKLKCIRFADEIKITVWAKRITDILCIIYKINKEGD